MTYKLNHAKSSVRASLFGAMFALLLFGLMGCAARVVQPEQAMAIRSLGIVSLLSSDLVYEKIGVTVFNNEKLVRPVGDALNVAARRGAERALSGGKPRSVIQLSVDVQALAKKFHSRSLVMSSESERIQEELAALAKQHNLDAILVIADEFDFERGMRGVQIFFRALSFREITRSVIRPEIVALLVDSSGKSLVRANSHGIFVPIARPDGQPWAYELEKNIDGPTHDLLKSKMQNALEEAVFERVRSIGL